MNTLTDEKRRKSEVLSSSAPQSRRNATELPPVLLCFPNVSEHGSPPDIQRPNGDSDDRFEENAVSSTSDESVQNDDSSESLADKSEFSHGTISLPNSARRDAFFLPKIAAAVFGIIILGLTFSTFRERWSHQSDSEFRPPTLRMVHENTEQWKLPNFDAGVLTEEDDSDSSRKPDEQVQGTTPNAPNKNHDSSGDDKVIPPLPTFVGPIGPENDSLQPDDQRHHAKSVNEDTEARVQDQSPQPSTVESESITAREEKSEYSASDVIESMRESDSGPEAIKPAKKLQSSSGELDARDDFDALPHSAKMLQASPAPAAYPKTQHGELAPPNIRKYPTTAPSRSYFSKRPGNPGRAPVRTSQRPSYRDTRTPEPTNRSNVQLNGTIDELPIGRNHESSGSGLY